MRSPGGFDRVTRARNEEDLARDGQKNHGEIEMNRTAISTLSILIASALPLFADDLTMTSKVTNDGKTTTSVTYMSKDHVRVSNGDGKESIVDAATGQMTTIDTARKTYYVVTPQDIEKFAAKMQEKMNSPEMKKAQEAMKNQPAMSGMFDVNVQKTGVSRKIAGYSCDVWKVVAMGGMSTTEECITNDLQFPMQLWDTYRKYSEGMKNMMSSMGPMGASVAKMQEQMKKMKGFPIATKSTVDVMGRKMVVDSELTDVKHGAIPASMWAIPAGYTKVDSPMMKSLDRRRS